MCYKLFFDRDLSRIEVMKLCIESHMIDCLGSPVIIVMFSNT